MHTNRRLGLTVLRRNRFESERESIPFFLVLLSAMALLADGSSRTFSCVTGGGERQDAKQSNEQPEECSLLVGLKSRCGLQIEMHLSRHDRGLSAVHTR
jgi:hypothetical protein